MPLRFRTDLEKIDPYQPGRPAEEVAAEYGIDDVVKLASNESPGPPFPESQAAIADNAAFLNRYPDNAKPRLTTALAAHYGLRRDHIWCGGASNELTLITGLSMGGPGTSAVHAWPSFGLYSTATRAAFAEPISIPVDAEHRHDLDAMAGAVRDDTTVVYICNPNNPTSTHVPGDALEAFIDGLSENVLVVIDEAYAEYATAPDYRSMLPLASSRPNVMVTRTFSKVYGLAGLRVGYAVTAPETIIQLRRIQLPFSVNTLAEVAAVEALHQPHLVERRIEENAAAVAFLSAGLSDRGYPVADSQTNFVYAGFGGASEEVFESLMAMGVIVRPVLPAGWLRVTAGTPAQNKRFLSALDRILR
jgi:histidinol-phosphate aminotransferase